MASSRTILIAGAGIAGLSAAKALADRHFRAIVIEQAPRLEETGAGIQLSPNATRALFSLGLEEQLKPHAVAPEAVSIRQAQNGRELARIPLGRDIAFRYGTPYWVMHRGDLQAVLRDAAIGHPDISLHLGARVEDFALHPNGVTVQMRRGVETQEERGIALIGADGLWSLIRTRLGLSSPPLFQYRTAWRALVDADDLRDEFREPLVQLWLGRNAHLVHYPVSGGRRVNVVAIVNDRTAKSDWSTPGAREDIMARFSARDWAQTARDLMNEPESWLTWSLYDRPAQSKWGHGAITLIGDAAHPTLPYLAQGAAMAIEDAVTVAKCLEDKSADLSGALRMYEGLRRQRTARVRRAARFTGKLYHMGGPQALARNVALGRMGQEKFRERYDWLYDWRRV